MTAEPAPRPRNRRGEGGRLRAEILAAAAGLLDASGDEQAVTLRAVARRIGIAAPSIYAHFPDRQAIVVALVHDAFADLAGRLRTAGDAAAADPERRLRAVATAYLDFAHTRPQHYRLMFGGVWSAAEAVHEGALSPADAAELGRDVLEAVTEALSGCVRAGVSTSTDPASDAVALWLGLHGLASQRAYATAFTWPADIGERLLVPLAHLRDAGQPPSSA